MSTPHGNIGNAFQNEFQNHRHLMLRHKRFCPVQTFSKLVGAANPDRLAAEAFGDSHVIGTSPFSASPLAMMLSKARLTSEIHVEAALRDGSGRDRIVHDHMNVGQQ